LKHSPCRNIIGGFFIHIKYKKLNLEGYHALHKKPPGRSMIRKKDLLWALRAASSSFELPAPTPLPPTVSPPAKVSAALTTKIVIITFF
jgi:hypothetical protein